MKYVYNIWDKYDKLNGYTRTFVFIGICVPLVIGSYMYPLTILILGIIALTRLFHLTQEDK